MSTPSGIVHGLSYVRTLMAANQCLAQTGSGGKNQLVGPKANREVFICSHKSRYASHLYLSGIRSRFYRSGMSNDIQVCYRTCKQCAALKKPLKSKKAPLKPIGTDCPLQRLGMDFAGLHSTAGNQFTLVVVDYFTRYVAHFGAPDQLHIDQGQSVEAELMLELGRLIQIQSTAYNL
ncbi:hypothetical protein T02_10282 [Trichinella nativa]|uniref:Integrase catalytic domain-containing protein n=1 Tax=Trichinella nativa TaxID=6335 RepID=A0A0V1KWP0_9BILA|nr:hypothetical protein T02_10282 [Trichinella nativa]